jgi:hypothetical protein
LQATHARTAHIHQLAGFERPELSRPHLPEVLREQILRIPHLLPRPAAAALSLLTLPRDWIVASRDEQNGVRVQFCIAELISEISIDETFGPPRERSDNGPLFPLLRLAPSLVPIEHQPAILRCLARNVRASTGENCESQPIAITAQK